VRRRKNPLVDEDIGLTPQQSFGVDWLHTLSLGVFQTWCYSVLQALFSADAWQTQASTREASHNVNTQRLSSELASWFKAQDQSKKLTPVRTLSGSEFESALHPRFPSKRR
jgi:hypothetical protein